MEVKKKADVKYPRSYQDYRAVIHLDRVPKGIQVGFQSSPYEEPTWGKLPNTEHWFHEGA